MGRGCPPRTVAEEQAFGPVRRDGTLTSFFPPSPDSVLAKCRGAQEMHSAEISLARHWTGRKRADNDGSGESNGA